MYWVVDVSKTLIPHPIVDQYRNQNVLILLHRILGEAKYGNIMKKLLDPLPCLIK